MNFAVTLHLTITATWLMTRKCLRTWVHSVRYCRRWRNGKSGRIQRRLISLNSVLIVADEVFREKLVNSPDPGVLFVIFSASCWHSVLLQKRHFWSVYVEWMRAKHLFNQIKNLEKLMVLRIFFNFCRWNLQLFVCFYSWIHVASRFVAVKHIRVEV